MIISTVEVNEKQQADKVFRLYNMAILPAMEDFTLALTARAVRKFPVSTAIYTKKYVR